MSVLNKNDCLPSEESATIFGTLPGQFPNPVENDHKIKTQQFLDASSGVVTLVEKFGKVFAPVTHDINGNIRKISGKYEEDKENYQYLEDMLLRQAQAGDLTAVNALMWLRRALHFISLFFQSVIQAVGSDSNVQDLSPFIKGAYKKSLQKYHGWLSSQLFNILSRFTPTREQLFYHLALEKHNKDHHVLHDMKTFTDGMSVCVQKLTDFYQEHGLENDEKV